MRRALLILFTACSTGPDDEIGSSRLRLEDIATPADIPSTGPLPVGCARIEGAEIGVSGLEVTLAGGIARFTSWQAKDGAPGEYVGFGLSLPPASGYAVKSGLDRHFGSTASWVNPQATTGSIAHGISNVSLCPLAAGGDESVPVIE